MFRILAKSSVLLGAAVLVAGTAVAQQPQRPQQPQQPRHQGRMGQDGGHDKNILAVLKKTDNTATFAKLVKAADLDALLESEKAQYTVFVPTDDAFKKLGQEKLDELQKPENKQQLANILRHHIVNGKLTKDDLKNKQNVRCLLGHEMKVTKEGDEIRFDKARVTKADITADNGVVHLIDTVLVPEQNEQPNARVAPRGNDGRRP